MQTGILDRSRLAANVLMILLVGLNIFFSIHYTQNIKAEDVKIEADAARTEERLQTSRFMKLFIDSVLGTNGTISFEDRIKLENDIRQLNDDLLIQAWNTFVNSKDSEEAQKNAVRLMSLLSSKMI